jgi:hypothetical protein
MPTLPVQNEAIGPVTEPSQAWNGLTPALHVYMRHAPLEQSELVAQISAEPEVVDGHVAAASQLIVVPPETRLKQQRFPVGHSEDPKHVAAVPEHGVDWHTPLVPVPP